MKTYSVLGVMSGTSLDGVDILHCTIQAGSSFSFEPVRSTLPHKSRTIADKERIFIYRRWSI